MKIFAFILTLLGLLLSFSCHPSYQKTDNGIELKKRQDNVRIQFLNEDIVRVLKWKRGASPDKKKPDHRQRGDAAGLFAYR